MAKPKGRRAGGLAAVLSGDVDIRGRAVATIVTGGNVDPARLCSLLAGMEARPPRLEAA